MTDLSPTVAPKSNQLNADDLISGPRKITITGVRANESSMEQPIAISFDGDGGRPFYPCKTVRRVLIELWGADGNQYAGRSLVLYRDPEVTWGGMKVGGIRIAEASHIDGPRTLAVTVSKQRRTSVTIKPISGRTADQQSMADEALIEEARELAAKGTLKLRTWYAQTDKQARQVLAPLIEDLKATAKAADARMRSPGDDPFATSDDGSGPGGDDDVISDDVEQGEREREKAARNAKEALAGQIS